MGSRVETMFKLMTTYSNTLSQSHNHESDMVANNLLHLLEELAILKRVIQYSTKDLSGLNLLLLKLKTKNWKHCSKIIFKCVNSTVGPIFNIFLRIKWLWVPWTVLLQYMNSTATVLIVPAFLQNEWNEKKKKLKRGRRRNFQPNPNGTWVSIWIQLLILPCATIFQDWHK